MALIKCKECGSTVSSKADACPSCGVRLQRKPIGCGTAVLLVIGAMFVAGQIAGGLSGESSAPAPANKAPTAAELAEARLDDGRWACRERVLSGLKAPKSASFQNYRQFRANKVDEERYSIIGYVDAQNSFGAMIRTQFECIARDTGQSGWWIDEVNML